MSTATKLTYLTETKTLLKNKINLTGANITNDTFRQYPTKLQNALLECWNNEGEPIFTNWGTKVNGEGTNVKLDKTINARMKITPKGNTSQTGTPTPTSPIPVNVVSGDNEVVVCGKNLFDKTDYTNGKYLNTDGHESSNSDYGFSNYIAITSANNYYLSGLASGSGNTPATCFYDKDKTLVSGERNENRTAISYSSIPSNAKYMRISFKVADLNTIMLEVGSTATTYEPYTSQNYPLYLGVENLFDKSTATYQVGYYSSNGTLNSGGSSTVITSYIPIQPNTQYYLNGNTLENVCYYDENKTFIERITSNPRSINKNAYFIRCQFTTSSFDLNTIELTKGSTPQHISDTPIELCDIGNYTDLFFKAINGDKYYDTLTQAQKDLLTYGKWYLHKEIGYEDSWSDYNVVPVNNDETSRTQGLFQVQTITNIKALTNSTTTPDDTLCNNYTNGYNYNFLAPGRNVEDKTMSRYNTHLYIQNSDWSGYTNDQVKSALEGTILYYPLATPTNTEITNATLINQLEDLRDAMSYEGQTNISSGFMIVGASALGELK